MTPDEYRTVISQHLQAMAEQYLKTDEAILSFQPYVHTDTRLPWPSKSVDKCLQKWLEKHLTELSRIHQGKTDEELILDDLDESLYTFNEYCGDIRADLDHGDIPITEGVTHFLDRYDFSKLCSTIEKLCAGLEARGLYRAAKTLVSGFKIHTTNRRFYTPRRTKRHYLFETGTHPSSFGYDYHFKQELSEMIPALRALEEEMGVTGLSGPMEEIHTAFSKAQEPFESRTLLCEGEKIEAIVFIGHMNFRISHETADVLFAFVRLFSDIPLYDFDEQAA